MWIGNFVFKNTVFILLGSNTVLGIPSDLKQLTFLPILTFRYRIRYCLFDLLTELMNVKP